MTWATDDYCPGTCQGSCSCSAAGCGNAYGYSPRQCTAFCAHRINLDLGIRFGDVSSFGDWGNARNWASNAQKARVTVNGTPGVHSIVCLPNVSQFGHVAMVLEVGPSAHAKAGQIWVEDYNFELTCSYHQHLLTVSQSGTWQTVFLHLADGIATPPPPVLDSGVVGAGLLIAIGAAVVLVGRNQGLRAQIGQPRQGGYEDSGIRTHGRRGPAPAPGSSFLTRQAPGGYTRTKGRERAVARGRGAVGLR